MLIITAPSHRTRISRGSVTKCEQRRRACRVVAGPIITPISDEGLATAARERLIDGRNEELTPAPEGRAGRREGQGEHRRDFVPGDSAPSRGALWFGISCDGVSSLSFVFRVRFLSQAYGVSWLGLSRSFCRMFPPLLRKNTSLDVVLIFFPFGRIPLSLIYVFMSIFTRTSSPPHSPSFVPSIFHCLSLLPRFTFIFFLFFSSSSLHFCSLLFFCLYYPHSLHSPSPPPSTSGQCQHQPTRRMMNGSIFSAVSHTLLLTLLFSGLCYKSLASLATLDRQIGTRC